MAAWLRCHRFYAAQLQAIAAGSQTALFHSVVEVLVSVMSDCVLQCPTRRVAHALAAACRFPLRVQLFERVVVVTRVRPRAHQRAAAAVWLGRPNRKLLRGGRLRPGRQPAVPAAAGCGGCGLHAQQVKFILSGDPNLGDLTAGGLAAYCSEPHWSRYNTSLNASYLRGARGGHGQHLRARMQPLGPDGLHRRGICAPSQPHAESRCAASRR